MLSLAMVSVVSATTSVTVFAGAIPDIMARAVDPISRKNNNFFKIPFFDKKHFNLDLSIF